MLPALREAVADVAILQCTLVTPGRQLGGRVMAPHGGSEILVTTSPMAITMRTASCISTTIHVLSMTIGVPTIPAPTIVSQSRGIRSMHSVGGRRRDQSKVADEGVEDLLFAALPVRHSLAQPLRCGIQLSRGLPA